ncbi:hypothetical protein ACO0K7_08905 [Undibacterium sp. Ji67W]|uniref:hypothetical protein n=1 Tax=Undibacterium sp. Ji67W TaxID=3413042 RepID=UPI003BF0BC77
MKTKFLTAIFGLFIVAATPLTHAQVIIGFGFDSCGYPGFYQTCPAFGPPAGIYLGHGGWGRGRRDFRGGSRNEGRNEGRNGGHNAERDEHRNGWKHR